MSFACLCLCLYLYLFHQTNTNSTVGTGEHPTTALAIDFVTSNIFGGETMIDYGSGSGILSIIASQLGADRCLGIEIEDQALISSKLNAKLNGCILGDEITFIHPRELLPGEEPIEARGADVIVANILVGAILRIAPHISLMLKEGGKLCICGLRPDQADSVKRVYNDFIDFDESLEEIQSHPSWGEWIRLVGTKKELLNSAWNIQLADYAVEGNKLQI